MPETTPTRVVAELGQQPNMPQVFTATPPQDRSDVINAVNDLIATMQKVHDSLNHPGVRSTIMFAVGLLKAALKKL